MNLHKTETRDLLAFDRTAADELKLALPPMSVAAVAATRKELLMDAARLRARRTRTQPWRRAYNQFRRSLGLYEQPDVTLTYFARSLTHSFDFNLRMIHVVG